MGILLLTGAGGFVGPWLLKAIVEADWCVLAVARRPSSTADPAVKPVCADVTDIDSLRPWVKASDVVVHNAAYLPADLSDPTEFEACLRTNALATLGLLGLAATMEKPFIYISSGQGYRVTNQFAREDDRIFPACAAPFYLGSKLMGDLVVEHYRTVRGAHTAILRLGSLYGPGMSRGVVRRFVERSRNGQVLEVADGGRHAADLTFVGDVGSPLVQVLQKHTEGIFNIGSGRLTTVLEVARWVASAAGLNESAIHVHPEVEASCSTGFAALDITRASSALDFVPTPPEKGIARTWREWSERQPTFD